ncbi:MAG: AAA family ATPase [Clostridiales bacterium]|nr:AAA family ATPase [Clostridiales bacterium]
MESKILTLFSDVQAKPIEWLWKPYIPIGKVTLLQGDPNDGKSTMMMNIVAELSKGGVMPDGTELGRPQRIIYQCSEDDAGDTIKPRLESYGAACHNVAFIDEEVNGGLTIDDERLRQAIIDFRPRLVVIDPIQAYVENDSDLMSASKARRLMKRTGIWASMYNCAIVIIGHLNKSGGQKELYRGIGSIDLVASARSVLQVERKADDNAIRIVHHIKSSAVPNGRDFSFEIRPNTGFRWIDTGGAEKEAKEEPVLDLPRNKHELAALLITKALEKGPVESKEIHRLMAEYRIGEKTMNDAKIALGIKPYRKMRQWYWVMPDSIVDR